MKASVENPRFPHRCRILRKSVANPLMDEDDYSPLEERKPLSEQAEIIYEGECRSYERNTTSDRGEIITSFRGLALPLTLDDWNARGVAPSEGDEVAISKGIYTEYGRVIDVNPANFHGTHLTWRYGRN